MFEVKLAGARGETVKERVPYPTEHRAELTEEALAHLGNALCQAYHQDLPAGLRRPCSRPTGAPRSSLAPGRTG